MMKWYETVWEIFNQCPNNQMRDVFIEEIQIADIDDYVKVKFQDREVTFEKTIGKDGTVIIDILATGTHERISFTEI